VSNFDLRELSELWLMAKVKPAVVQRNSDPLNPDILVQQYARLTGMQYQVGIRALWPHIFTCTSDPLTVWMTCIADWSTAIVMSKYLESPPFLAKCNGACLVQVKQDVCEAANVDASTWLAMQYFA